MSRKFRLVLTVVSIVVSLYGRERMHLLAMWVLCLTFVWVLRVVALSPVPIPLRWVLTLVPSPVRPGRVLRFLLPTWLILLIRWLRLCSSLLPCGLITGRLDEAVGVLSR